MTHQQQIWRSKDADLIKDLAKYKQAIVDNQMPEMIPHWKESVDMIEHEIEQRNLLAGSIKSPWSLTPLDEAPF